MMNFNEQFDLYLNSVNNYLHSLLDAQQGEIYDAMRYSLYAGGKRIRPILSLAVSDSLNGDFDAALCYGSAIEMIHTYSLIHDDLPCMDNDDLRRGKPTNHIVFGENMAVLAGDALLNFACESIINSNAGTDEMKLLAIKEIFEASGCFGMIGGQVIDLRGESQRLEFGQLLRLHRLKTGALIKCAAALGALAAGYGRESSEYGEAVAYAEGIGLAFQVIDDILDVTADEGELGKTVGSDAARGKTTFLSYFDVAGAAEYARELTDTAVSAVSRWQKSETLTELAYYLLDRKN